LTRLITSRIEPLAAAISAVNSVSFKMTLNATFWRLMIDTGLLKKENGQNRTLYSLRHTYATFELLRGGTDIHVLSKQMGNSAAMIERHYSKLTATMAADRLA
jgi:integrase